MSNNKRCVLCTKISMNYHKTISQYRHWRDGVGEGREGRWGSDGAATSSFGGRGGGADIRGALEPHGQSCVATRTHVAGAEIIWHDESTQMLARASCGSASFVTGAASGATRLGRPSGARGRRRRPPRGAASQLSPSGAPAALTTASRSSSPPGPSGRLGARGAAWTGPAGPRTPPGWAWERGSWASGQGCGRASC